MRDKLREILRRGIQTALDSKSEHSDSSLIMQGKAAAFGEVLAIIDQLDDEITPEVGNEK
jgi:hypothetical protein